MSSTPWAGAASPRIRGGGRGFEGSGFLLGLLGVRKIEWYQDIEFNGVARSFADLRLVGSGIGVLFGMGTQRTPTTQNYLNGPEL